MNAINAAPSNAAPSKEPAGIDHRPYEPSMEEILASIRRIIADDQSMPSRPPQRDSPPAPLAAPPKPAAWTPSVAPIEREPSSRPPSGLAGHGTVAAPQLPQPDAPPPLRLRPYAEERAALGEPSVVATSRPVATADRATSSTSELAAFGKPRAGTLQSGEPAPIPRHLGPVYSEPSHASPAYVEPAAAASHAEPPRRDATHDEPEPAFDPGAAQEVDPYFDPPIERDEPLPEAETPAGLFSNRTKQSVSTAFSALAASRLANNSEELLGVARDMIRPMLKTWLDDNLPSMVERMVREEIERVARGGR